MKITKTEKRKKYIQEIKEIIENYEKKQISITALIVRIYYILDKIEKDTCE